MTEAHPNLRPLLDWYDDHRRDLPWRGSDDPYAIWVSEVMSQQTRIETVIDYWKKWLERFPTVEALAAADSDEVMSVWAGLGYYRRARFLLRAARQVVEQHDGQLPTSADGLRELPGIGEYTAGAIASIAFDEPVPAVDGNVTRVVARLHAIEGEPGRAAFRRAVREHAGELVDPNRPGCSNQALMELGATVCTPRGPRCLICPLRQHCEGFATGDPEAFPPPRRRKPPRPERRTTLVAVDGGRMWMRRCSSEGLLAGLWEFPNVVSDDERSPRTVAVEEFDLDVAATTAVGDVEHVFSHIEMTYEVHLVEFDGTEPALEGRWLTPEEMEEVGVSTAMRKVAEAATRHTGET